MNYSNEANNYRLTGQVLAGVVVLVLGILLLLDQFNVIAVGNIFQFIPTLFIVLAIWQLISNRMQSWIGPVMLIVIMTVVQLNVLDLLDGSIWRFWPLLLILGGSAILLRQYRGEDVEAKALEAADRFNIFAMFSGVGRTITAQDFSGGEVTALFGGAEIDLTNTQVTTPPAVINVFVMFGGLGIKASRDLTIDMQVLALFGGAGDERKQRKRLAGEPPDVIVKGLVLFGGVGIEE